MIKSIKSISKRTLALVLSMLMLLSSGIVGTLAANVELAPTGKTYVSGEYIYFKNSYVYGWNNTLWIVSGMTLWGHLYSSSASTDVKFSLYSGTANAENAIYRAKIPSDATYTNVVFARADNSNNGANAINYDWGQSYNVSLSSTANTYYNTYSNGNGSSTSTTYTASKPATCVATVTDALSGTGTSDDPYLVAVGSNYTVQLKATKDDAGNEGFGYNINSSSSKAANNTTGTYTKSYTAGTTADVTSTYTGYAWCYEYSTSYYSSNYTSSEKIYVKTVSTSHNVTFMNDGSQYGDIQTIDDGAYATVPNDPSKDGYTFKGWSTAENGTVVDISTTKITEDTTFYAVWEINQYTITYYNDDKSTVLGTATVDYNTLISAATAPAATKDKTDQYEYAFNGWTLEDGTAIGSTKVTGDVSVYATYTPTLRSYKVNYSGANGTVSVAYADGTVVPDGSEVPYGTELTLTATPDKFYNFDVWVATVGNSSENLAGNTYTVTSDVTLEALFAAKTTRIVRINQGGALGEITAISDFDLEDQGLESGGTTHRFMVEDGASIDFVVKAPVGYYISRANYVNYGYTYTQVEFSVINVTEPTTDVTVIYAALPTYNVTVSANDDTMGTVTGANDAVIYGNQVHLTAAANEGYRFVNWTIEGTYSPAAMDLTLANISIIPQENIVATANFVANAGTINVSATEGGTVTNEGANEVTYPETVTSTAEADTANGYLFTHWTVTSDGTEGTDYTVSKNDNVITVQILTDGTVVDVVANFANAQKIKVYTYSESGFTSLKVTESNGTKTLTPFDGSQSTITFGDETWYTPGELTLTAGYSDAITAQMYGSSPLESGTGTLIMFDNSKVNWSNVYLYTGLTYDSNNGANTNGAKRYNMTNIGGTNYWYTYVATTSELSTVLFVDTKVDNWNNLNSGQKAAYRTDAPTYYQSAPMFVPTGEIAETKNECNYYSTGSWKTKPTVDTSTEAIDITSELYDDTQWLGKEEIWLYFDSTLSAYVATDRRQLNDYVTSALIKKAYNSGTNDAGYTSDSWSAFTTAYTNAVSVLGAGASDQDAIDTAYTNLETAYNALALTTTVTITGSHGAMPGYGTYFGKIAFPDSNITVTSKTGNIGDSDSNGSDPACTYLIAEVDRNQVITINTTVTDSDYMVLGWVVNGTEFISATQDIANSDLFVGTYTCSGNAVIVPIYFRDDTIAKFNSDNEEDRKQVIKLYAKADENDTTWGNYMSAYTWTGGSYRQFGRWTGQLMIPDVSSPGMYYTYVEVANPEDSDEVITGITFNNYGNNKGINSEQRYQTYDYYEFIELANQEFDNIVFTLKTFQGNENNPSASDLDMSNNSYIFDYFRDFSGNIIDITRTALDDEQKNSDPALYIVRTGPCDPDTDGVGYGWADLEGSDFYVNAYIYSADGTYLGRCKTYELLDLEKLKSNRKIDLTGYAGSPVMVDYASLTDTSGNKRYDGEWFGTKYGFTNVTISAEVAYLNTDGTVTYYNTNEVENIGNAYFNGEHTQEVSHGSEGHTISSTVLGGNDFVGWYRATVADDGTYTIDITADPLFTERSATIDASADAIYVAVFKEHPEGTFTVNNFYYTYADFSGQTVSPYAPPVFGGDSSYSIRDVMIKKVYDDQTGDITDATAKRAGTYTQSLEEISVGDELEITIYTKPTYSRDYVYAWYIQADDSYGVNFEEIGTNELKNTVDPGAEKSFTFTYTVKEGVSSLTIYSDVVHVTPEVTLTYIYNNRYNVEQKYIVKHTLTNGELASYTPSPDTISDNAPDVGDLYKEVSWDIDNVSSDATNWTLRATENATYTVNAYVNEDHKTFEGVYNSAISIYASDIDPDLTNTKGGLWYSDIDGDGDYTAGKDKIISYGSYYGLVITGNADIYYVSDVNLAFEIILADAVYNAEKATDDAGNVTTNKVYVDYLISYLIPCFNNGFLDLDGDGEQDDNEYVIGDPNNAYAPVSLEAIEAAGYTVDYGMVLELINTFRADTSANEKNIETYYGTGTMSTDYVKSFLAGKTKASETGCDGETYYYKYSAKDLGSTATNKNRVLMTFGYNNTTSNRNRYYNAIAYLTISDGTNTYYFLSNQATLNIAEVDEVES